MNVLQLVPLHILMPYINGIFLLCVCSVLPGVIESPSVQVHVRYLCGQSFVLDLFLKDDMDDRACACLVILAPFPVRIVPGIPFRFAALPLFFPEVKIPQQAYRGHDEKVSRAHNSCHTASQTTRAMT